ncbi:hypothetical protein [Streptomyces asoensis]|uniref:Uncharacterized protein n=1 Tax=Streptomyces asoensis TaxID=249586 RepID=A0ABQ3S0G1_9ACTN|nr:hypothetical protein [Streptomyces asoensis]GGQ61520.1 hypothetical protein GCM10010496_26060 [Streptomyces asoensis]GHI61623.1 hypothetical protein Saso_32730 [Streptomyces asoensis]
MREGDTSINSEINQQPIIFRSRPRPVPPTSVTAWRISALILTLSKFHGSSASADHLNILMHSLRTPTTRARFVAWWEGSFVAGIGSFNLEPSLEITIRLAHADGLVSVSPKGRIKLLEPGMQFALAIAREDDVLTEEKQFLESIVPISTAKLTRAMALIR